MIPILLAEHHVLKSFSSKSPFFSYIYIYIHIFQFHGWSQLMINFHEYVMNICYLATDHCHLSWIFQVNMVIFQFAMLVYQRVSPIKIPWNPIKSPLKRYKSPLNHHYSSHQIPSNHYKTTIFLHGHHHHLPLHRSRTPNERARGTWIRRSRSISEASKGNQRMSKDWTWNMLEP